MDFIDIDTVLTGIADCVPVNQAREFRDEVIASEAAGLLRQTLRNVTQGRPRWVECKKIDGKPEFNDAVIYPEGMAMLEHTSGWHGREIKNRTDHVCACLSNGLDPNVEPMGHNPNDGQYPRASFFRPREIGFDRGELVEFLAAHEIAHTLGAAADGRLLIPLGDAAPMLVNDLFGDLTEPKAVAMLAERGITGLGSFSAIHMLRNYVERDVQRRIDDIVRAGSVRLYDSISLLPTNDISTALVERGELVKVLQEHPAPDTTEPQAAPVVAVGALGGVVADKAEPLVKVVAKRRGWRDVAWPYVVETFKADQYSTAKAYYRALENKAGANDSPFDKGTGVHLHSLYVREISETVTFKTIQNAWKKIKASR